MELVKFLCLEQTHMSAKNRDTLKLAQATRMIVQLQADVTGRCWTAWLEYTRKGSAGGRTIHRISLWYFGIKLTQLPVCFTRSVLVFKFSLSFQSILYQRKSDWLSSFSQPLGKHYPLYGGPLSKWSCTQQRPLGEMLGGR